MPETKVVIIASPSDAHAQVVAKRVEQLDGSAAILDSADYPTRWRLNVAATGEVPLAITLQSQDVLIDANSLTGIWWRRPRRHIVSVEVRESNMQAFVQQESQAAFNGWLHCMGRRVINPIAPDRAASHKVLQLQCAASVGMQVPRTLVTNDGSALRRFYDEAASQVVFKPFTGSSWSLLPTRRLTNEMLAAANAVSYSPVIFQEEIKKVADVRVNVVDGQTFAVLIRSGSDQPLLDWRLDRDCEYSTYEVSSALKSQIIAYMARLSLRFAAFDFGLTADGQYIFFEANTGGQWLFAEIMTGQEISWALAHALLQAPPPLGC